MSPAAEPGADRRPRSASGLLSRGLDRVEDGLAALVGAMLLALILVIVYDVLARQIGIDSAPWTVPLAEYYVICLTFLPAAWILRQNGHVAVDFLGSRIGPHRARLLALATAGVALAACGIAGWYSLSLVLDDYQRAVVLTSGGLSVPRWLTRAAIPIGFFLLSAELVRGLLRAMPRKGVP
ncbi:MAG: TRAP transporter small permease [Mycobacteriales bacterium]